MMTVQTSLIKSRYLIPILLGVFSFALYSYHLQNQPWHGDEVLHNSAGVVYYGLLKDGDLYNPCWNGIGNCTLMVGQTWLWPIHYGHIAHIFIGLGRDIVHADNSSYYAWSCFWTPCWNSSNLPSPSQFEAGRVFSPIFGSLTVVMAYFIGRLLFDRMVGVLFSVSLLFSSLWMWNSRVAMVEPYFGFFIMLMLLLLIISFQQRNKTFNIYFLASAVIFGVMVNTKLLGVEMIGVVILAIILRRFVGRKISIIDLKDRKENVRVALAIGIFLVVAIISIIVTNPYFYPNPIKQFFILEGGASSFDALSNPSLHNDNLFRAFATFHTMLVPYSLNYYGIPYHDEPQYKLSNNVPFTYSSVPVSIFFFIALGYLVSRMYKRKLTFSEFFLIAWLAVTFVFSVLTIQEFRIERYFIPLLFPVLAISAYGLSNFLQNIKKNGLKTFFVVTFVFCHAATTLVFWKTFYQSPDLEWANPLKEVSLQVAFVNPVVWISSAFFIALYIYLVIKNLKGIRKISFATEKKVIAVTMFFLVPAIFVGYNTAGASFANEVIVEKIFQKEVLIGNKQIFSAMADLKDYPKIIPKQYVAVDILNKTDNVTYTKETLQQNGLKLTMMVKHTIEPYHRHTIEVLSGYAKGTKIIFDFTPNGTQSTIVKTDARINLSGILAPLGIPLQYEGVYGSLSKINDEEVSRFEEYAKVHQGLLGN